MSRTKTATMVSLVVSLAVISSCQGKPQVTKPAEAVAAKPEPTRPTASYPPPDMTMNPDALWLGPVGLGMSRKELLELEAAGEISIKKPVTRTDGTIEITAVQTSNSQISLCDVVTLPNGIELRLVFDRSDALYFIETDSWSAMTLDRLGPGLTWGELKKRMPNTKPVDRLYRVFFPVAPHIWLTTDFCEHDYHKPIEDQLRDDTHFPTLQIRSDWEVVYPETPVGGYHRRGYVKPASR